jgi:hypothetical protein
MIMKTPRAGMVCVALTLLVSAPALAQTGHDLLQQALVIVEAEAPVAVQLAQHTVLFLQVGIDGSVLLVHPARDHHHEHLQRRVQYPSTRRFQNAPRRSGTT